MRITNCRTNHMLSPLGFAMEHAVVSWLTESEVSRKQIRAQIKVALDKEMHREVYSSELDANPDSTGFMLPVELQPRTAYYWQVQVWGDGGDTAVSDVNTFETGKRQEQMGGAWITTPWENKKLSPYIRKQITLPCSVQKARLYITGLGLYLSEINGKSVSDEFFAPGCTAVDRWVQIYTYDVTKLLHAGDNVLGVMMGNGWAKGRFGAAYHMEDVDSYVDTYLMEDDERAALDNGKTYVNEYLLNAELRVELENGSEMVFVTDETWKCAPSPILEDGLYDGEVFDENKVIPYWSGVDCFDESWDRMLLVADPNLGALEDRLSLPVKIMETVKPLGLIHTPAGETVLDMGQNMTGWVRFRVKEPMGSRIRLQHGEILQNGCFYNDNLRAAKAEYVYISDGTEKYVQPHFTFYGFRYVKIEGIADPRLEDFVGCVVYSDLEETGWLTTSDSRINQLFKNVKWSQKDNFLDVPTDCPQRDERMGWTGDAQVFCKTGSYNMDSYAFYTKFLHDLWREQEKNHGMVSHVIPTIIRESFEDSGFWQGGACTWGDAATIMPWTLYEQYGDVTILQRQYPSMKAWVDWILRKVVNKDGIWDGGYQFGDWLALDGNQEDDRRGGTDEVFIASVYLKYSAELVAQAAQVLDYKDDEAYYDGICQRTKAAIQKAYYHMDGRCKIQTQTAQILSLVMDIVPREDRRRITENLIALLRERDMHLSTGFVGTPFLCMALSMEGHSDVAYEILFKDDFPSWLYEVDMGATTIWERWDSVLPDGSMSGTGMNSLNHYTYGSIARWMYENMAGLTLLEPGFKRFQIRPEFTDRFSFVDMKYRSAKGWIKVKWERIAEKTYSLHIKVPFDTTAVVCLPAGNVNPGELAAGEYDLTVIIA